MDQTAPDADRVLIWDDVSLHDVDFQHSNYSVGATWHGFYDKGGSHMHHFTWCVGSSPGGEDVVPCTNVAMAFNAHKRLDVPLTHGISESNKVNFTVYFKLKYVNTINKLVWSGNHLNILYYWNIFCRTKILQ